MKMVISCKRHPDVLVEEVPFLIKVNDKWELDLSEMWCPKDGDTPFEPDIRISGEFTVS